MQKLVLAVGAALLAGLAVGAWMAGGRGAVDTMETADGESEQTDVAERILRLEQMLADERAARVALGGRAGSASVPPGGGGAGHARPGSLQLGAAVQPAPH